MILEQWAPFVVSEPSEGAETAKSALPPRSIDTLEGVGDRMRAAAFAEFQAIVAFGWAADRFTDAPIELRDAWRALCADEERHYTSIMNRMKELGIDPAGRAVSDRLWQSLKVCTTGRQFAHFIANAEERGRRAGLRFHQELKERDPETAAVFLQIVEEEVSHVALAQRFYPSETLAPNAR